MEKHNFNQWLSRRQNVVGEGVLDWIRSKFKTPTQNQNRPEPESPDEINKTVYDNPLVHRYTDIVLRHWGLQPGAHLVQVDQAGTPKGDITVTNWSSMNHEFYQALQRFIAAHIMGQGETKSYLRISHHDAIIIIQQLDGLSRGQNRTTVADELNITSPEELTNWIQSKVPTAPDAVRQQGFSKGTQDFVGGRVGRGKGSPMGHPSVRNLVAAAEDLVAKGLPRIRRPKSLRDALVKLDTELFRITGKQIQPDTLKKRPTSNPSSDPGDEGEVVDTGSNI